MSQIREDDAQVLQDVPNPAPSGRGERPPSGDDGPMADALCRDGRQQGIVGVPHPEAPEQVLVVQPQRRGRDLSWRAAWFINALAPTGFSLGRFSQPRHWQDKDTFDGDEVKAILIRS